MELVIATSADEDRVFQFLCDHFYPDEPINASIDGSAPNSKHECVTVEILKGNLSVLAVKKEDPSYICGVFLNKARYEDEVDNAWPCLGVMNDFIDYAGNIFFNHMKKLWKESNTNTAVEIVVASVRKECRGHNLAQLLMQKSIEVAKENKHQWMMVDCSSAYSAIVFEKAGFYTVHEILYKDYKDKEGNIVFKTKHPHLIFQMMVKNLNSN